MTLGTRDREHWTRVSLQHERDGARIARLVVGVAIYLAAALMLLM
jgi:hypothetical protein